MSVHGHCLSCRFHEGVLCRVNPPTVMAVLRHDDYGDEHIEIETYWPETEDADWCGRYEKETE